MTGDNLPDKDHVTRYGKPLQIEDDDSINGTAYRLRPGEEYLSVNWIEYLKKTTNEDAIMEIINTLSAKFAIKKKGCLARSNVGTVKQKVLEASKDSRKLIITHQPETDDRSHSGIFNLKELEDDLISDLIAQTVTNIYLIEDYQ